MRRIGFIAAAVLSIAFSASAQTISGVINEYRKVVEFNGSGQGWVRITPDTDPYAVGDTVLLIQMQGAEIDETNDAGYGDVTSIGEAGNYEKNEICRIDGDTVFFRFDMVNDYDPSGAVQLVTVPKFPNVTVTGTLTADPWDGNVGGIVIFEAAGDVILEGDIDVSGQGFRGGLANGLEEQYGENGSSICQNHPSGVNGGNVCPEGFWGTIEDYFFTDVANFGAPTDEGKLQHLYGGYKGEGIAEVDADKVLGRGKQASGGGGGNVHNAGGAGGGNYGAGGHGGAIWSGAGGFEYGGDGGLGVASTNLGRIFLGGGGGGGQQNFQVVATDGKNGGGIVIISAGSIIALDQQRTINADGLSQTILSQNGTGGDGAGGGGAGGTIILETTSYIGDLEVTANGGDGGDVDNNECLGPGGGGGGGLIMSSSTLPANVTTAVTGGQNGENVRAGVQACSDGIAHYARPGEDGAVLEGEIPFGTIDVCTPCNAPNADITPTEAQVVCVGETVILTALHPGLGDADAEYQWLRNGGAIMGETGKTFEAELPGNYSVEILDITQPNNPACPGTSPEVSFSIISEPTIQIFGNDIYCPGDSVQLTAFTGIGVDIQWFDGSGEIAGATDSLYFAKTPGTYYAVAGQGTCTATSNSITVNEATVPDPSLTASTTDPVCDGDEVVLEVDVQDPTFTYVWYRDGGAIFGGTGSFTYSATVSGDYHVQVTDPDAFECPGVSDTITVHVLEAPSVNVTGGGVFCEGEIELTVTGSNGGDITWFLDNSPLAATTETITVTTSGRYKADVDLNGCTSSDSTDVVISPTPTAGYTVDGDTEFCQGDSVTLEATPNGSGEYDYLWLRNGNVFSSDSVVTTVIAGTYKAIVINEQGCRDTTDEIPVTVLELPNATINGGGVVCEGSSVQLSTSAASTYQWYKDDAVIPGADEQTYFATEAGLYKVLLTNGTCADTSAEVEVLVEPTPDISISGPTVGCSNEEIELESTVVPADNPSDPTYLYQWFRDAQTVGVGIGHDTLDINLGGSYTVKVTIGQCSATSPAYVVDIDIAPSAAIIPGDQTICTGDSVLLVGLGGENFEWFIDDVSTGITNDSIYAKTAGTYKLVVSNGNCEDSTEVTVTVENDITVTVDALPSATECELDSLLLTASSNISNAQYIWYEEPDATAFADGENVWVSNSATYRVEGIAGDNCINDASIAIQVENIDPFIEDIGICGTTNAQLNGGEFAGATYEWYKTDAIDNKAGTLVHDDQIYSTNIEGFYWLRVEKGDCIDSSNVIELLVSPEPTVEAFEIDSTCATLGIQLAANASGGTPPYEFVWGPDEYLNDPSLQYPLANGLEEDVTFSVAVIDSKGCGDVDDITIDADKERFVIPNIFTPNGDGVNDFFVIKGVEEGGKLRIANRWGDTIYYIKDYDNTWNGEDLNDGVYYYNYISPCDEKEYKGWVQILR